MRIPDNLDIFEMHEREQERLDRLRKRVQREYEKEDKMSKSRASKQRGYSALIGRKKPEKCIYESKKGTDQQVNVPKDK